MIKRVSPSCFYPVPDVSCSILEMTPKKNISIKEEAFFELVRKVFQKRRKKLSKTLAEIFPKKCVEKAFLSLELSQDLRPENLSPEIFYELFKTLTSEEI